MDTSIKPDTDDEGRIDWDILFLEMALLVAERSGCERMQVGCIITSSDHEQMWMGYNGSYKGGPNTCERPEEPGNCGCDAHAEENAIAKCDNRLKDKIFYITALPCRRCAKMIINSGASRVVCISGYRSTEGLEILEQAGLDVEVVDPPEMEDEEDEEE